MHKFWKINDSKKNKFILIKDKCIYKGNPKQGDLNKLNSESSNFTFLDNLFSIPYTYIKQVENPKNKNEIKIYYGNDSEDELIIDDTTVKNEIFNYLKNDMINLEYSSELPNILKYAKAQFFALLFTSIIFIWSLYLAIQIENGAIYQLNSGRKPGITGIVLAIAHLGVFEIIGLFIILLTIILFSLFRKIKSRDETEFLRR